MLGTQRSTNYSRMNRVASVNLGTRIVELVLLAVVHR